MPEEDMGEDCPDESMNGMDEGMSDDPPEPDEGNGMDEGMSDDPPEPDEGNGMDEGMADDCPTDEDMDETDMDETDMDETDMDETDMDETDMDETDMAPEAPITGTGLASTSNTTSLAAILGVMALAITLGGYTFARRRR